MTSRYDDYPPDDDFEDEPRRRHHPRRRHSWTGIASFAIALGSGLWDFGMIALAGILEETTPGGLDEGSPASMIVGLGIIAGGGACVVGLALGVAGLLEHDRNPSFAVIGLALNGLVLAGLGLLLLVGLTLS